MCDDLLRIRMNGRPFKHFVADKYTDYFVNIHERCDMPEVLSPFKKPEVDQIDFDDIIDEDFFDADLDYENEMYLSGKSIIF